MTASRSVISDEEKIARLKEDCRYPALSSDPSVQKLFLMEKITPEELNRVNPTEIDTTLELLQDRSVQQRLIDRDWTFGDVKQANVFKQVKIFPKLITFCKKYNDDISWEVDASGTKTTNLSSEHKRIEKRFSPALIELLKDTQYGICSGLTILFLANAYLSAVSKEDKTIEIKDQKRDNLRKFYKDLKAIASWDGNSALGPAEQALFCAFLYRILQFQDAYKFFDSSQDAVDKMLLFSEQSDFPFVKEESYTMTVTREQLAEKLSFLKQYNRLTYIASNDHALGRFNNLVFNANNLAGDFQYQSEHDLASIFFKGFNLHQKTILISITQFRHRLAPAAIYPPHEVMLENCSDPTVWDSQSPLLMASCINDLNSFKIYLSKPQCDVNAITKHGYTALIQTALYNYPDMARTLLQERKDCAVNAVDAHGMSALMRAVLTNHPNVVRILLQERKDCDISIKFQSHNALMLASQRGYVEVVRVLLQERKDCAVNAVDAHGMSALMLASQRGHIGVVRALLQECKDLDINAVDKRGASALVLAIDDEHMKVARVLIEHGAAIPLPHVFSPFSVNVEASFDELRKQKELNLANPVIRDCITKGLLNENEASVLSPIEREKLQDKTLLDETLQRVLREKMLTMEQLLELNPLEISVLKIVNNTLALFPADESRVIKHESAEDYLRNTFSQLKDYLNRWVEQERKGETDSSGRWLISMQAILNIDIQNTLLSTICENLKTQYINQLFLEMNFLLNSIQPSVPKTKSLLLFSKSPGSYLVELNNVINSKMTPAAKLQQIRKTLDFASKKFPDVKLFTEMAAALNDYPYFKIFTLKKEMGESKVEQSVRVTK